MSAPRSMPGRNTGKWRWTPVVVLDHDGVRYLISAYGDTEWSRNLRASGARRLTRRGRVEPVTAVEVPVGAAAGAHRGVPARVRQPSHGGRTIRALPDPADHPTFRIHSAGKP